MKIKRRIASANRNASASLKERKANSPGANRVAVHRVTKGATASAIRIVSVRPASRVQRQEPRPESEPTAAVPGTPSTPAGAEAGEGTRRRRDRRRGGRDRGDGGERGEPRAPAAHRGTGNAKAGAAGRCPSPCLTSHEHSAEVIRDR